MINNSAILRRELKEKFLREFTPSERVFFLKKAKEAILLQCYPPNEELFYYCYFLTLKERLRRLIFDNTEAYARFLLVETMKEMEDTIKYYHQRLESQRLPRPDVKGMRFIEYLEE
jgi:hypothetical protein